MSADNRSVLTPTGAWSRSVDEGGDVVVEWFLDLNPLRGLSVLLGRGCGFDSERGSELER